MATDRNLLKQAQIGHVGSAGLSAPTTAVKESHRRTYTWVKTAIDTNATDNTAEFCVVKLERASRLIAASYAAIANVASAANNTIQMTVGARLAADPANAVVVANSLSNVAPWVAWTPLAITLVANAVDVTANSVLTFKVLKANSGTALAAGVLTLDVEEI